MSVKEEISFFNQKYPLKTRRIEGTDFTYRYAKTGQETLVLLPGGIGKSDLFYRHFLAFTQKYSVLTFDYPLDYKDNSQLALAITRLIKELGIGMAYLVGQSYGGFLAQIIAKYHPEVVKGLVLSNTGSLSAAMNEEGARGMQEMLDRLQKMKHVAKMIPIAMLKKKMKRNMMDKVANAAPDEQQLMNEIADEVLELISSKSEQHMCGLMADLSNEWQMRKEDFAIYKGKVLLLLSDDDPTFNEGVKQSLIEIMPSPTVRRDISGGHLALFLSITEYLNAIGNFIG